MTAHAPREETAACLAALEAALAGGDPPALARMSPPALDDALRALAKRHGAASLPLLERLAGTAPDKDHRRAVRRALYRLEQSGLRPPRAAAAAPAPWWPTPSPCTSASAPSRRPSSRAGAN